MDRFVSNYTLRLDAKGRISIPASYRAVLARDGFDGLYCYPSLDRPALDAGGNSLMTEIEQLITAFSPYSDEREEFSVALYGTSETLKIDGEGRVILGERLIRPRGDHRRSDLRRHGLQVSNLGAGPLSRAFCRGHRQGACAQAEARFPECGAGSARSTGTMTGRDTDIGVAGGSARHIPVLGRAAVEHLNVHAGGVYIDGTFGAGGHTRLILEAADARVIALDRDPTAIAGGAELKASVSERLSLVQARFSELEAAARDAGAAQVDGVLLDLGVSSMQLDEAGRGFSFRRDGPLDMRMSEDGPSAADVVAHASVRDLARIIGILGEEKRAGAIARAIVADRAERAFRDDAYARRSGVPDRAEQGHPPGDAHVPGVTHVRQRRARRDCRGTGGGGTDPQTGRPACRHFFPFARGPAGEVLCHRAQPRRADVAAYAPDTGSGTKLPRDHAASGWRGPGGDRR